jgi:phosphotransferase system IIB component
MSTKNKRTVGAEESRFNAIMNSRLVAGLHNAGEPVRCKVSGNPLLGYWDERIVNPTTGEVGALKDIYSFNVSKLPVIQSPWFKTNHANAIALEAAGEVDQARELFNKLMNATQLTMGIINRDGTKAQFASNQLVDVVIGTASVEDKDANGNLLGTTHTALIAEGITPVTATKLTKQIMFGADVEEIDEEPAKVIGKVASK